MNLRFAKLAEIFELTASRAADLLAEFERMLSEVQTANLDCRRSMSRVMVEARCNEIHDHRCRTMFNVWQAGHYRRMLHPNSGFMARAGKRLKS